MFLPDWELKIPKKIAKKFKKLQCVPTRPVIENSKIVEKEFKNLENTIIASFQAKIGRERLRKREKKKKKIVTMDSYPTGNRKF